jgi:hypothetical protein
MVMYQTDSPSRMCVMLDETARIMDIHRITCAE